MTLISSVTDAVVEEVKAWQSHPLISVYPIVYLDCISKCVTLAWLKPKLFTLPALRHDGQQRSAWLVDRSKRG